MGDEDGVAILGNSDPRDDAFREHVLHFSRTSISNTPNAATSMKPFKPPTIVGRPPANSHASTYPAPPPHKKRKISQDAEDDADVIAAAADILKKPHALKKFQPPPPRKPLEPVQNPNSSLPSSSQAENGFEGYFIVVW